MAKDYVADIRSLISEAQANGWGPCPDKPNTLRRISTHATPERIPANWWPFPEYKAVEFLSFVVADRSRAPKVIHGVSRTPWLGRVDRSISYRKATELMAQPIGQSPVHSNH